MHRSVQGCVGRSDPWVPDPWVPAESVRRDASEVHHPGPSDPGARRGRENSKGTWRHCPAAPLHSGLLTDRPGGPPHDRSQAWHPALEPGAPPGRTCSTPPSGSTGSATTTSGPGTTCTRSSATRTSRSSRAGRRSPPGPWPTERIAARPARRRQHLPQPGPSRQDGGHARPHQRRPGDPRHRRSMDGRGAPGPRHRLRERVRPAARLAGRSGRRRCGRPRRQVGDLRAGRPLPVRRPAPPAAAAPAAPADHDRRQRREEDAAHGRALRRHVERDGPARRDRPQGRRPARALRRGRARHRRDRVHARRAR